MQLFTSSWFANLPDNIARIGISRGTPRGQSGYRVYRALAPGPWFRSVDYDTYREHYFAILAQLDPEQVVADLNHLAGGRPAALLCFETAQPGPDWCHRAMVSVWLQERLGLDVPEYGLEEEGCGWSHPKLPPSVRRADAGPSHPSQT
jgi:hypothetical protein